MPLDSYWERRLDNWAMWAIGASSRTWLVSGCYRMAPRSRPAEETGFAVMVGDALDTNDLVVKLPENLQRALIVGYIWSGTHERRARDAGINPNTLRDRINCAKARLQELHAERRHAGRYSHASPRI